MDKDKKRDEETMEELETEETAADDGMPAVIEETEPGEEKEERKKGRVKGFFMNRIKMPVFVFIIVLLLGIPAVVYSATELITDGGHKGGHSGKYEDKVRGGHGDRDKQGGDHWKDKDKSDVKGDRDKAASPDDRTTNGATEDTTEDNADDTTTNEAL